MNNPYDILKGPTKEEVEHDEWSGQFSCSTVGCNGWANTAKYFPKMRVLAWECQEGHISKLRDIDE